MKIFTFDACSIGDHALCNGVISSIPDGSCGGAKCDCPCHLEKPNHVEPPPEWFRKAQELRQNQAPPSTEEVIAQMKASAEYRKNNPMTSCPSCAEKDRRIAELENFHRQCVKDGRDYAEKIEQLESKLQIAKEALEKIDNRWTVKELIAK